MKNKKSIQICAAVVSVAAALGGAFGFYRVEMRRISDAGAANALIVNGRAALDEAEALDATEVVYSGAPTYARTTYDEPVFTQALYDYVDANRPENQLSMHVAALASDPALADENLTGATYCQICGTAIRVGTERLDRAQAAARRGEIACAVLFFAGILSAPFAFVRLFERPAPEPTVSEAPKSDRIHSLRPVLRRAG